MRTLRGATIRTRAFRPDFCSKVIDIPPSMTSPQPTSRSTVMVDCDATSCTGKLFTLRRAHFRDGRLQVEAIHPVDA